MISSRRPRSDTADSRWSLATASTSIPTPRQAKADRPDLSDRPCDRHRVPPGDGNQFRYRLAVARDHEALSLLHAFEKLGQVCLGGVCTDISHGGELVDENATNLYWSDPKGIK